MPYNLQHFYFDNSALIIIIQLNYSGNVIPKSANKLFLFQSKTHVYPFVLLYINNDFLITLQFRMILYY